MEVGVVVMQPEAKECPEPREAATAKEVSSFGPYRHLDLGLLASRTVRG